MMYEPLLAADKTNDAVLQNTVFDAKRFLQTLVRLYYLRHGFENMDLFVVIPLMLMGYDCIDALGEARPESDLEVLRSTLLLVAKGLQNQRRNHYLAEALFRVIRGRMRPQEVALLRRTLNYDEDKEEADHAKMQAVRSHWPVSIVKKQGEMDSYVLANLVESYGSLGVGDPAGCTSKSQSPAHLEAGRLHV